jgi:hypothetical protein
MRAKIVSTAVFVTMLLIGWRALAQEIVATPDPVGGTKIDAGAGVRPGEPARSNTTTSSTSNDWRYRWFEGRWWYWTPQNRWLWYSNDGRWVEFDANQAPLAVDQSSNPPVYQGYYPGGGYYYPGPGYYYGAPGYWGRYYYPGVAVGVRPYGNVNVGVGGRVGVDVWGPHGAVRVGGIHVGW